MSPMNNRLLVPTQPPGVLDFAPGAAAAYSLRSLSRSYADPVVTVRRSSDDAEEDFTAAEVDDGTLAAFCGAGDGFVYRWWDQSGNANHAVAAADTNEPKIVDSGVVITEEGKPALQFDGNNDYFSSGSILSLNGSVTLSLVTDVSSDDDIRTIFSYGGFVTGGFLLQREGTANKIRYADRNTSTRLLDFHSLAAADGLTHICALCGNRTSVTVLKNSVAETVVAAANSHITNTLEIGRRSDTASQYWNGRVTEIVFWQADLTQSIDRITGNTMWYY